MLNTTLIFCRFLQESCESANRQVLQAHIAVEAVKLLQLQNRLHFEKRPIGLNRVERRYCDRYKIVDISKYEQAQVYLM